MMVKPINRWQAFAIHLLLSAVIFFILAFIIVFIWYPGVLFRTDGGWQGIRLIAGVDFIIGPILTLVVYDITKKRLKWDLAVIALVQFACLTAGTWIVYEQRPVAVIYAEGTFYTLSDGSFDNYNLALKDIAMLERVYKPKWIYVKPGSANGLSKFDALAKFGPAHIRYQYYAPLHKHLEDIKAQGQTLEATAENLDRRENVDHLKIFPIVARYYEGNIIFNTQTGNILRLYDL